jgi:zeaxanthin glucosyltransferase
MAHFGIVSPPSASHITGFAAIGRELIRHGHRVTVFNILDARSVSEREGLQFVPLGTDQFPLGFYKNFLDTQASLGGLAGARYGLNAGVKEVDMWLTEGLQVLRSASVDVLLVDKLEFAGSTLAELLKIPFVTVCNACVTDEKNPSSPPSQTPWPYSDSSLARLRNRITWTIIRRALSPLTRRINFYRKQNHLAPLDSLLATTSPHLELSQQTEDFDFPRRPRNHKENFHYIGLLHRGSDDRVSFPFERLNGQPLVYATFGTLLRASSSFLQKLSEACRSLSLQLVVGLGGTTDPAALTDLGDHAITIPYAPQRAILRRAALTVCHSGLNTVLESLEAGVPVVAVPTVPQANGVAARLVASGAGEKVSPSKVTASDLTTLFERILTNDTYRQNAARIQSSLQRAGAESRAAQLILEATHLAGT